MRVPALLVNQGNTDPFREIPALFILGAACPRHNDDPASLNISLRSELQPRATGTMRMRTMKAAWIAACVGSITIHARTPAAPTR